MSHTPTPWKNVCLASYDLLKDAPSYIFEIRTPDENQKIALLGLNKEADAEFIVRACNSYDNLIELLKETLDIFWERRTYPSAEERIALRLLIESAIAKAEGKESLK